MKRIQLVWNLTVAVLLVASGEALGQVRCRCSCQNGICTCTCGDAREMRPYANTQAGLTAPLQISNSDETLSDEPRLGKLNARVGLTEPLQISNSDETLSDEPRLGKLNAKVGFTEPLQISNSDETLSDEPRLGKLNAKVGLTEPLQISNSDETLSDEPRLGKLNAKVGLTEPLQISNSDETLSDEPRLGKLNAKVGLTEPLQISNWDETLSDEPTLAKLNAKAGLTESLQISKSDESPSNEPTQEKHENPMDESSEIFREALIPMETINGTRLRTGVAYRIFHEPFGRSPVVVDATYEGLEVRIQGGTWWKAPFMVFAERRQSEWSKYIPGGSHEYRALFMLIKSNVDYELINLAASGIYPASHVCFWEFWHFTTSPKTSRPNTYYCGDEPSHCAFIINGFGCTWSVEKFRDNSEKSYRLRWTGKFYEGPIGFESKDGNPRMGLFGDKGLITEEGNLILEMASAQLTGTIVSFKVETKNLQNLQQVELIQSHDIINNSSKEITQTFQLSKTLTSTYTYGFSNTFSAFAKLSVKAEASLGIGDSKAQSGGNDTNGPTGTVGAGFETGLEVGRSGNQQWSTTSSDTFSIDQVVTIPPFRRITVSGIIEVADNVELGFVSQINVSMNMIRLTKHSRSVVKESVPRTEIRSHLNKHVAGRIIQETAEGVIFESNGTLKGSFGVRTILHVTEFPVINGPTG